MMLLTQLTSYVLATIIIDNILKVWGFWLIFVSAPVYRDLVLEVAIPDGFLRLF